VAAHAELVPLLRSIFPNELQADVDAALATLPPSSGGERLERQSVSIRGESVGLLGRLYSPVADEAGTHLTERQRLIRACLYSRHHDGFVRERQIPALTGDEPWLPHFVLQLVGEYVIEICQSILDNIDAIPRTAYEAFAAENPEFMAITRSRVVSYYYLYYVRPRGFVEYPGYRFLSALGLWEGPAARRWIRGHRF
jgi:hypothetical protein